MLPAESMSIDICKELRVKVDPVIGGRRIKVLIAKIGLDGHDRGAKVIARALRDAGFDVVYLGVHQTPESVIRTAIEEDVDVIGISILSGSHIEFAQDLAKLVKEKGLKIPILFGGIIPPSDIPILKRIGIAVVHGPGTSLRKIIEDVYKLAIEKRKAEKGV